MHSKIASSAFALIATVGLASAGLMAAHPASAATPIRIGGCPEGFAPLDVAHMESIGPYILPRLVDDAGNGDGTVCGHQLPVSAAEAACKNGGRVACELVDLGLPYYHMTDDNVPGQAG